MSSRSRCLSLTAAALVAAGGLGGRARAGWDTDFVPSVRLSAGKTGSVNITGTNQQPDVFTSLALQLAMQADNPTSSVTLSYTPQRVSFADFNVFDNTAHTFNGSWRYRSRSGDSHNLRLGYQRTQQQGLNPGNLSDPGYEPTQQEAISFQDPGDPVSVVPRTTLQRGDIGWGGRTNFGPRSNFTWNCRASAARFENRPDVQYQDSNTAGVRVGWGRSLSPDSAWAVQYGFRVTDFENAESQETNALRVQLAGNLGRDLTGLAAVGFAFNEIGPQSFRDPTYDLSLNRTGQTGWSVRGGLRQSSSSGIGLGTGTLDRTAYAGYNKSIRPGRFGFNVNVNYTQRRAFVGATAGNETLETLTTQEGFSWAALPSMSVGVSHRYVNQELVGTGSGATQLITADFHSLGIFIAYRRAAR